jgi:preprotein translocase subunit YajC
MFATPAFAQATSGAGAAGGGPQDLILQLGLPAMLLVLFYFLMMRPQQQRQKKHQEQVGGLKRGDTVVLSSGMIGQVTRVDETEVTVEISPKVEVKVVKSMIADVRLRGAPVAANDPKPKALKS